MKDSGGGSPWRRRHAHISKPRTPRELGRFLQCGRVAKRKGGFLKGFVVTELLQPQRPRLRTVRPAHRPNGLNGAGSSKDEERDRDSEETLSDTELPDREEEDASDSSEAESPEENEDEEETEQQKSLSSDAESEVTEEELAKFGLFESTKRHEAVALRRVAPKVFEAHFRRDFQLFFQGRLQVRLEGGVAQVLGWRLRPGRPERVFSNRGASLVGLEGRAGATLRLSTWPEPLDAALRRLAPLPLFSGLRDKGAGPEAPATSARLLAERSLDCKFLEPESKEKVLVDDARWSLPCQQLLFTAKHDVLRVMVCGGKGLGKSTFVRLLINKMLSQQEDELRRVLVLDLDPGQAEFTAPGRLSVVEVCEPLLGPSFTHLKTPLRSMLLGEVDASRCVAEYLRAAEALVAWCASEGGVAPLVVNTMGFNAGAGVALAAQVALLLRRLGHLHVVELRSLNPRRNYPDATFHLPDATLVQLPSVAEKFTQNVDHSEWGMQSSVQREICVLAYLSPMMRPPHFTFLSEIPFVIRLGYLVLGVVNEFVEPNLVLRALVGNLVALCSIPEDHPKILRAKGGSALCTPRVVLKPPALPCHGYGVVAGVDLAAGQLYLQTPERAGLREVNCLLLGGVQLPSVLRTAGAKGRVPFVATGDAPDASAPLKPRYRPISSLVAKRN